MCSEADHPYRHGVVVTLGPEYGKRAGKRILIKAIQYSLVGPLVFFPTNIACKYCGTNKADTDAAVCADVELQTNPIAGAVGIQPLIQA